MKRYLTKLGVSLLCGLIVLMSATSIFAKVDLSELFVNVTEASLAVEKGQQEEATKWVAQIKQDFLALEQPNSEAGKAVQKALELPTPITETSLVKLSTALLAYEKEQNPVDEVAGRKKLEQRILPTLDAIQTAIKSEDLAQTKEAYKQFNTAWTANEAVIRDTDSAYYGKIETSVALLRSATEVEPVDFATIQTHYQTLNQAIRDYLAGKTIEAVASNATLADGIQLLEKSLSAFQSGNTSAGSDTMRQFIEMWPSIEGDISTRNPDLYNRVENDTPVMMVKGQEASYQQALTQLIAELKAINPSANYTFVDAMSIILREGVEALLIILALVTGLKSMQQKKGIRYIYAGAVSGLVVSGVLAVILALFIPVLFAGTARELIEAYTGLFAVLMLGIVGIWLHQRSSLAAWQRYMNQQLASFEASGKLLTLFGLSFLAVFREGAETILFFVGILPKISAQELWLGVGLAVLALVALWFGLTRMAEKIVAHRIFAVLSVLIYILAFKMLGVSVHTLQVTNTIGVHPIIGLPAIDLIGFYPTWETVGAQLLLIAAIVLLYYWSKDHGATHD